jgi:hypothetical protein
MDRSKVNETFSVGGYYSYKIPETDITFLGMNSMYFKENVNCSKDVADQQLFWLET